MLDLLQGDFGVCRAECPAGKYLDTQTLAGGAYLSCLGCHPQCAACYPNPSPSPSPSPLALALALALTLILTRILTLTRRARLQKRYGALQLETEDQLLRLQTASIEQQELLQLAEARGSRLDTELAEERKLRLESASNLFRLRGTIVKQIVTKLSGDLVGRCFRAWRDCTQQHAAFKSLQGRGELVISQPSPGEASRDGKRSPSPYVASEVRANSFRPSSNPNTRFAA